MTRDLTKLLADYVKNKLDPETEIEIDGLILLYVDGELDSERAAEIKAAMDANPAVAASISHSMRAAKTVQEQLMPADEDIGELPPDPVHDKWLADLMADPNAWGKDPEEDAEPSGVVVPLQAPSAKERPPTRRPAVAQPTWGALAASIAVLLTLGGGAYLFDSNRDMQREEHIAALDAELQQLGEERQAEAAESDRLTRQVTALGIQLSEATAARDEVNDQLAEAVTAIDALTADQAELAAALAAANDEITAAQAARDDLEQQIASLDAETRQTIEERVSERDELTRQVTELENRLDDALAARDDVTSQLADARAAIDALDAEKQTALSQVAALESDMAGLETDLAAAQVAQITVRAQVEESEQRIDALEDQLNTARVEIAEAEQANALLAADRDQQLQQATAYETALNTLRGQTDWLAQVAGYHIGYAGKAREVEVKVEDLGRDQALVALSNWLSSELDHQIKIPTGLPVEGGLEFVGGRVLPTISGTPVGQIAYHDDQGRLTAFCIKRNPTGVVQGLEERQFFGQLQMIHWQDEDFQYVVVGFADFEALMPAAEWLQENYGEET